MKNWLKLYSVTITFFFYVFARFVQVLFGAVFLFRDTLLFHTLALDSLRQEEQTRTNTTLSFMLLFAQLNSLLC